MHYKDVKTAGAREEDAKDGVSYPGNCEGKQPEVEKEDHQVLGTFTVTVHSFIKFWIGIVTVDERIQVFKTRTSIAEG